MKFLQWGAGPPVLNGLECTTFANAPRRGKNFDPEHANCMNGARHFEITTTDLLRYTSLCARVTLRCTRPLQSHAVLLCFSRIVPRPILASSNIAPANPARALPPKEVDTPHIIGASILHDVHDARANLMPRVGIGARRRTVNDASELQDDPRFGKS
ncbi:hypothetical protein PENSPDRAFT_273802 [Peniophora sp. CONT]|nr:hypothetical protein PENSPDRAFT_273802 [Peniophora sp. CONT]